MKLEALLARLTRKLTLSPEQVALIASDFTQAMVNGLQQKPSPLKMLPAYLSAPTGREAGSFLALDFGGTNVRALLFTMEGRHIHMIQRQEAPLSDQNKGYDYSSSATTAEELFLFLASLLQQVVPSDQVYRLGHTFSFPCRQYGVNEAELLTWTKEIHTSGVEGKNITALLQNALGKMKLYHVKPVAVINDTVGVLLTSAYSDCNTHLGSICGTGHNTAYLEPKHPLTNKPMIVNMESGNFHMPRTDLITTYDQTLDKASGKPGEQLLEKMASGRYLGEITRLILVDLIEKQLIARNLKYNLIHRAYSLDTGALSLILNDQTKDLVHIERFFLNTYQLPSTHDERLACRTIASLVAARSARLIAATWLGALQHIDPTMTRVHTIAVDGSLYEKMPGYAGLLQETLNEVLGNKSSLIRIKLVKDGSGAGAAIAAALT